jgi:uncharacterized protein with NRDE domain
MTPGYRLVVAANRDEFLNRPTAPLYFLDKEKTILAGQDLQGGGTWLGVAKGGKFAAITNYREASVNLPEAPSRGEILLNFFDSDAGPAEFCHMLAGKSAQYNGFNLILGDSKEFYYYSNRAIKPQRLTPGFYGLCNHLLDTPWPKIVRGSKLLRPHMIETVKVDPGTMFELLQDTWCPPDRELPDTGVPIEWERILGSVFIDSPDYGTRSSAVLTVSDSGIVDFSDSSIFSGLVVFNPTSSVLSWVCLSNSSLIFLNDTSCPVLDDGVRKDLSLRSRILG